MIIARTYSEINESELRAFLHCAQFGIEQTTGQPLHKSGPVPRPGSSTIAAAQRILNTLKREIPNR